MIRTFIQTTTFANDWDSLGLNDDDLRQLELDIMENPTKHPVIEGTGGLRKLRIALNGHGRRGGARVCYVDYVFCETIYLIAVYSKKVKEDLSQSEKQVIKKLIGDLERSLKNE